jgi:hypothetical protein
MCGYIVKVYGSKSRGVRAIGNVNLCKCIICLSRALAIFRAWHVTSTAGVAHSTAVFLHLLLTRR